MLAFVVVAVVLSLSGVVYAEDSMASIKVINSESLNKFRQHTADLRQQNTLRTLKKGATMVMRPH
jgi:hypothetical protein